MKVNSGLVKKLRSEKSWSQEQLAEACGLSLRTIQRLESTGNASIESVHAVAKALGIDAQQLLLQETPTQFSPLAAVKDGLIKFDDFSSTATRAEYWWFFAFIFLILAIGFVLGDVIYQIVSLIIVIPLVAAGTRRLNDVGRSGWWQLFFLVPFGQVVVLYLLAQEGEGNQ